MANGVLGDLPEPMGILGRIGQVLNNPTVQGIGAAAAFGLNPLLGLAAAPAFAHNRDRVQMANQVARERLLQMRERRQASGALDDLIAMLAEPQAQQLAPGQMGPPEAAPARLGPEQAAFLRLAGTFDPRAALQGVGGILGFGQSQEPRGLEGRFQSIEHRIGRPLTEQEVLTIGAGTGTQLESLQSQLNLSKSQLDIQRALFDLERQRDQAAQTDEQAAAQEAESNAAFLLQIERDLEAADLLDQLEGSFLARPGFGSEFRGTIASAAGLVDPESEELSASRQRFDQLATISGLDVVKAYDLRPTDQKFRALMDLGLSANRDPRVNRLTLLERYEAALQRDDDLPGSVREELRRRVEGFRSLREPGAGGIRFLGYEDE